MIIGMFSDRVRNTFLWIKSSKKPSAGASESWQRCARHAFAVFGRPCGIHFILPLPPLGLIRTLFEQTLTPTPVYSLFLSSADIGWHDLDPENTARYLCRRRTRTLVLYPPTHVHDTLRGIYLRYGLQYFRSTGPGRDKNAEKRCVSGMDGKCEGAGRGLGNIQLKMPSYESGGDGGGGVYRRTWGIRAKRDGGRVCTRVLRAKALKDITIKNNVPHKSV